MKTNILKAMMKGTAGGSPPAPPSDAFNFHKIDIKNVSRTINFDRPLDLKYISDGSKIAAIGDYSYRNSIVVYTLTTPYSLGSILTQQVDGVQGVSCTIKPVDESTPFNIQRIRSFAFSSDGLRAICGDIYDYGDLFLVHTVTFSTAWDVSTKNSYSYRYIDDKPCVIRYNTDGTKVFIYNMDNAYVHQWDLSTAWDFSTAVKNNSKYLLVSAQLTGEADMHFSHDGTVLNFCRNSDGKLVTYTLSTAWDVTTATLYSSFLLSTSLNTYGGFNQDGSTFIMAQKSGAKVFEYALTTPYVITTLNRNPTGKYHSLSVGADVAHYKCVFAPRFNTDGTKIYYVTQSNSTYRLMLQYSLTTPWELTSIDINSKKTCTRYASEVPYNYMGNIFFNPSGYAYYVLRSSSSATDSKVFKYTLSTAWDISTSSVSSVASYVLNIMCAAGTGDIWFNDAGTRMYISCRGSNDHFIYQYVLSTPWDIATASKSATKFTGYGVPEGNMVLSSDGTKLYINDMASCTYFKYDLTTPFDVSTKSWDMVRRSPKELQGLMPYTTEIAQAAIGDNGTKIYIAKEMRGNFSGSAYSYGIEQVNIVP